MPKVRSEWKQGRKDVIVKVRTFSLTIDHPIEQSGTDLGPTPSETLLSALAGCFTGTMVVVARAMKIPLAAVNIEAIATKGEREYESLKSIEIHLTIEPALEDRSVFSKLVDQTKRNCTITNTLLHPPEITLSY